MRWLLLLTAFLAGPAIAQSGDYLPPPLLGPPKLNLYGPGKHADVTGRPFSYRTQGGARLTVDPPPVPNGYGLGVGRDLYGRPVEAEPDWSDDWETD